MKGVSGLIVAVLVLAAIGILYATGYLTPLLKFFGVASVAGNCQDIYCADFKYVCCVESKIPEALSASRVGSAYAVQCPSYATRCIINQGSYSDHFRTYSSCVVNSNILGSYYTCSGMITDNLASGTQVSAGQWVWSINYYSFTLTVYKTHLISCGYSGCDTGEELSSSGCAWITNADIYSSTGSLLKTPVAGQDYTYTVPYDSCYTYTTDSLRRVCGSTCESCTLDSDCVAGRTYTYTYNGVTYGAGFSDATHLVLYGCKQYGNVPSQSDLNGINQWKSGLSYNYGSRCDSKYTITVSCAPGSDSCGPSAFCDANTFTCKTTQPVGCTQDYECGISQTACDFSTKTLKAKGCVNGQCGFKTTQNVECCSDANCPTGGICLNYNCVQQVVRQTTCPYECCVAEASYFDKPCAEPKQCLNHACVGENACVTEGQQLGFNQVCCDGLTLSGGLCTKKGGFTISLPAVLLVIVLAAGLIGAATRRIPIKYAAWMILIPLALLVWIYLTAYIVAFALLMIVVLVIMYFTGTLWLLIPLLRK